MKYPDFLRHIVNPILSKYMIEKKNLRNHVDEIRKFVLEAENKYKFSIFGGNPEKLVDYFLSEDFKLLIDLFESCNSLEVLREILVETKKKYHGLPQISKAINRVLRKIRQREKEVRNE